MTNEGIKAVRFCLGYSTNLRHQLDWCRDKETCFESAIRAFLMQNRWGIFGSSFIEKSGASSDFTAGTGLTETEIKNNAKIITFIRHEAYQVCVGKADEK